MLYYCTLDDDVEHLQSIIMHDQSNEPLLDDIALLGCIDWLAGWHQIWSL